MTLFYLDQSIIVTFSLKLNIVVSGRLFCFELPQNAMTLRKRSGLGKLVEITQGMIK